MTNDKAIFFDEREQRWRRTRNILTIVAAFAAALLAIFAFAVFEGPELPPEVATTGHDDGLAVVAGGSTVGAPLKWLSRERGLD